MTPHVPKVRCPKVKYVADILHSPQFRNQNNSPEVPGVCQRPLRGDIKINKTECLPSRNSAQKMGRLSVPAPPQHLLSSRSDFRRRASPLLVDSSLTRYLEGVGVAADPAPGCFSCPLRLECGKIPTGSGLGGKGSWAPAQLKRELIRKEYFPLINILSWWEEWKFCFVLGWEGFGYTLSPCHTTTTTLSHQTLF